MYPQLRKLGKIPQLPYTGPNSTSPKSNPSRLQAKKAAKVMVARVEGVSRAVAPKELLTYAFTHTGNFLCLRLLAIGI